MTLFFKFYSGKDQPVKVDIIIIITIMIIIIIMFQFAEIIKLMTW